MVDSMQKKKKLRLDVSKSKGKTGTMLYVRSIFTEPIVPTERLAVAKELVDKGITKAVVSSSFEKSVSLIKKTKSGSGCKDSVQELCEKLVKIPDIQSNPFGESRMMVLKANKKQVLDTCTTNANIGILVSSKDDVRLTVAGATTELKAGEPLGLDFCLEASCLELSLEPFGTLEFWFHLRGGCCFRRSTIAKVERQHWDETYHRHLSPEIHVCKTSPRNARTQNEGGGFRKATRSPTKSIENCRTIFKSKQ